MFSPTIHFEVSERKILLRLFDVLSVIGALYLLGFIFEFDYLYISRENFYWTIVLAAYINILGTVFEMYNLQTASSQFQIIKSILLTSATTVLFYLLTPILTPVLPSSRLQIIYFFLGITLSLFAWRMFYQAFLASHRFLKKVVMVCDKSQLEELAGSLQRADPHYKILGFINTDSKDTGRSKVLSIENIDSGDIALFMKQNAVSEIVIASRQTDGITASLYNNLLDLLEKGYVIR
ncbi:MAG TPA: sugar transferase, partial [Flavobacterium sp.]|nr:sugar transferase [Flavobacterium sp.]